MFVHYVRQYKCKRRLEFEWTRNKPGALGTFSLLSYHAHSVSNTMTISQLTVTDFINRNGTIHLSSRCEFYFLKLTTWTRFVTSKWQCLFYAPNIYCTAYLILSVSFSSGNMRRIYCDWSTLLSESCDLVCFTTAPIGLASICRSQSMCKVSYRPRTAKTASVPKTWPWWIIDVQVQCCMAVEAVISNMPAGLSICTMAFNSVQATNCSRSRR